MLPRPTAEPIAAKMKAVRPEKAPRFARRVAPGGGGWVDALKVRLRGSAVGRQLGVTTARWGTRGGGEGQGGAAEGFCAGSDRWWALRPDHAGAKGARAATNARSRAADGVSAPRCHVMLPLLQRVRIRPGAPVRRSPVDRDRTFGGPWRSEEHTSELQSRGHLVCRLLLDKKNDR